MRFTYDKLLTHKMFRTYVEASSVNKTSLVHWFDNGSYTLSICLYVNPALWSHEHLLSWSSSWSDHELDHDFTNLITNCQFLGVIWWSRSWSDHNLITRSWSDHDLNFLRCQSQFFFYFKNMTVKGTFFSLRCLTTCHTTLGLDCLLPPVDGLLTYTDRVKCVCPHTVPLVCSSRHHSLPAIGVEEFVTALPVWYVRLRPRPSVSFDRVLSKNVHEQVR